MNAGEYLLLKSSLTSGSAADHLLSAISSGDGLIINDGVMVEVSTVTVISQIDDIPILVEVSDHSIGIPLKSSEIIVEIMT